MIFSKDLSILQHLFFEETIHCIVYDPENKLQYTATDKIIYATTTEALALAIEKLNAASVLINLGNIIPEKDYNQNHILGTIHFGKGNKKENQYYYINNPDGSMRWVFPATNKKPDFLNLYNNNGWKAICYRAVMKFGYQLNSQSWLTNGTFTVEEKNSSLPAIVSNRVRDSFAIFTGTAGKNRKAIIALSKEGNCTHFVKIPLTKKAMALVQNENDQLGNLNKMTFQNMVIPTNNMERDNLIISNIQPGRFIKSEGFNIRHSKALAEGYDQTILKQPLNKTHAWETITKGLDFLNNKPTIQNEISKSKLLKLTDGMNQLFNDIGAAADWPTGLAHGDFTPWNMFETKTKIHVYDWEMSRRDVPLFFDLFHYVFQNNILIKRNDFSIINAQLEILKTYPITQEIIENHQVDWSKHYGFYLLYITSYYLPLYIVQKDLHVQVNWLMDVWETALSEYVEKEEASLVQNENVLSI